MYDGTIVRIVMRGEAGLHRVTIPDGLLVLAYGKLASHELTPTSDLDLVLIYDTPEDTYSTGAKSFPATAYYIRLAQRIMSADLVG